MARENASHKKTPDNGTDGQNHLRVFRVLSKTDLLGGAGIADRAVYNRSEYAKYL
jgi:hypothetical protein